MMRPIPPGVKVIAFDAVGTLIHPDPPFWETYLETASRYGIVGSEAERLQGYFREAFAEEERRDRDADWATSEERETDRWRRIVAACLRDATDVSACFDELFAHFARPASWRVTDGAGEVLRGLSERGLGLVLASNFDSRLRSVVAGLPEFRPIDSLVISSEVGHRKPAGRFFDAVVETAGVRPEEILYVGDDLENDYQGATAAGISAVLLDPNQGTTECPSISRITELEFKH